MDRPAPPRPPSIALRGPTPAKSSTPSLEVAFKATPGTNPIQRVVAFVEGRARGELVAPIAATASLAVALRGGPETISLVAFDSAGLSSTPLEWKVESPESTAKDRLWIVSAGANYPLLPEALRLPKAAVDAREVAHVLSRHAGPEREFAAVNQTVLVEDEVTGPRLLRAIGRLSQMAPTDVAVVFLAGHGVRLPSGDMVFLTAHTDGSKASIERDSVAWKDLASALGQAKGHVLVILDSCHSGHVSRELLVPNEQLAEAIRSSSGRSLIVYAAAKGEQLSIEEGWNGYFTRALLNALQSRSTDQDGDGWIEVSELLRVVSLVVSVDTAGRQTPWIARKELFGDYRLLRASRW